ncbi:hypothetical protein BJ322DRAFT_1024597 [Thelephora terrestris]|uniref:Uncharacterized protein n=1 Tax=Thelephora terrestris TaxID=56493 RepID=A0A9P6L2A4_9AGAM|nr:hypothetical protein BJ322DRAFT_1024597 [Thelephora terrestris]
MDDLPLRDERIYYSSSNRAAAKCFSLNFSADITEVRGGRSVPEDLPGETKLVFNRRAGKPRPSISLLNITLNSVYPHEMLSQVRVSGISGSSSEYSALDLQLFHLKTPSGLGVSTTRLGSRFLPLRSASLGLLSKFGHVLVKTTAQTKNISRSVLSVRADSDPLPCVRWEQKVPLPLVVVKDKAHPSVSQMKIINGSQSTDFFWGDEVFPTTPVTDNVVIRWEFGAVALYTH